MSLLKNGIKITKRALLIGILLFTILFTAYFIFSSFILNYIILSSELQKIVEASFNFIIAATLIANSHLIKWKNSFTQIYTSFLVIIVSTFLLIFTNTVISIALFFVIGIFFSIGLLGFLTYFWDVTVPEERGRIAGIVGFIGLPFNFIATYLVAPSLNFLWTIALSLIISSGIFLVILLKPRNTVSTVRKGEGNYFEKRTVLLYAIPWVLFSLVNVTLAKNASVWISQQVPPSFYLILLGVQFGGVFFGCLFGGVISDLFGRRLALFFSLTSYGASAALVGLFANNAILLFGYIINGFSWGILFILYIFVVWGDLANKENCGKMFTIGLSIYYLTIGVGLLTPISVPLVASSLATCLLVFLSNVPVALAPELLSPYFLEKMKLKLHIKAVKKIREQSKD